jgi:hypothetical protein
MMSAVLSGGKCETVENIFAASPARKEHFPSGRRLMIAFAVADLIDSEESSIPAIVSKSGASVNEKRPEPQYASTRCVGPDDLEEGKIASLTYDVRGTRTELLF